MYTDKMDPASNTTDTLSGVKSGKSYNERLFGRGLRGYLHSSRFYWAAEKLAQMKNSISIVELGCFDGKILSYLREMPERYLGFDANWEHGLDLARKAWAGRAGCEFRLCTMPEHFAINDEKFDAGICMETLEHVPQEQVGPYLEALGRAVTGKLLITVPNETGFIFLIKHLLKMVAGHKNNCSMKDAAWLTLGRTEKVARCEHKGFSWREFIKEADKYLMIERIEGLPFPYLPACLNLTICITARPRPK